MYLIYHFLNLILIIEYNKNIKKSQYNEKIYKK